MADVYMFVTYSCNEAAHLSIFEFFYAGAEAQFSQEVPLLLLLFPSHLFTGVFYKKHQGKSYDASKLGNFDVFVLFSIFLSSSSSKVGRRESLLISLAPMTDRSILRSSSETA